MRASAGISQAISAMVRGLARTTHSRPAIGISSSSSFGPSGLGGGTAGTFGSVSHAASTSSESKASRRFTSSHLQIGKASVLGSHTHQIAFAGLELLLSIFLLDPLTVELNSALLDEPQALR